MLASVSFEGAPANHPALDRRCRCLPGRGRGDLPSIEPGVRPGWLDVGTGWRTEAGSQGDPSHGLDAMGGAFDAGALPGQGHR